MAWQIDKKWQQQEPGCPRSVLPAVIIRAASLAATIMLLGFAGMLHPSEMMALIRRDWIFPADVQFDSRSLFLKIRDPKTNVSMPCDNTPGESLSEQAKMRWSLPHEDGITQLCF